MSEQRNAIELANELESDPITNRLGFVWVAADELRRLSAANAELEEMNADLREQNTEVDAACAKLEAANAELLEALRYSIKQVSELATVPGIAAAIAKHGGAA